MHTRAQFKLFSLCAEEECCAEGQSAKQKARGIESIGKRSALLVDVNACQTHVVGPNGCDVARAKARSSRCTGWAPNRSSQSLQWISQHMARLAL